MAEVRSSKGITILAECGSTDSLWHRVLARFPYVVDLERYEFHFAEASQEETLAISESML